MGTDTNNISTGVNTLSIFTLESFFASNIGAQIGVLWERNAFAIDASCCRNTEDILAAVYTLAGNAFGTWGTQY